jgi:hypothetical protein
MKLVNETRHPAALFRGELQPDLMHAALLTRVRLRCDRQGRLLPVGPDDPDALTELRSEKIEDDYGVLEADIAFPRAATDVIILADAAAPRPTQSLTVGVRVGPYQQSLLVTGDRTWQRTPRGVVASTPEPFERMPLTFSRAYGGKARSSHGELANPSNPLGKGYYLDEASAIDQPLPNIEDPRRPIRKWDDRPDPVGVAPYPPEWFLRQRDVVQLDGEAGKLEIHPERGMFDRAHPSLSGHLVRPGDPVEITGTAFAPKLAFTIPPCPVEMVLALGDRVYVRELELEEVLLDLRVGLVDLGYRKLCSYDFVAHQPRSMILRARTGGSP